MKPGQCVDGVSNQEQAGCILRPCRCSNELEVSRNAVAEQYHIWKLHNTGRASGAIGGGHHSALARVEEIKLIRLNIHSQNTDFIVQSQLCHPQYGRCVHRRDLHETWAVARGPVAAPGSTGRTRAALLTGPDPR